MTSMEERGPTRDHGHVHAHSPEPAHDPYHVHGLAPARHAVGFSLLRLSALQRLGIVAVALILIWSGVHWALS
jgi:hypothetical protein